MAKITIHVTPMDAAELAAITAALTPFVSTSAPAAAEAPSPVAQETPEPKRRAPRKAKPAKAKPAKAEPAKAKPAEEPKAKPAEEPKAEEPKAEEPAAVPPTEPAPSTEQTSNGGLGSREALIGAMRSALMAGKRAEVAQVFKEFGVSRATELKDEDVAAATAMVAAL